MPFPVKSQHIANNFMQLDFGYWEIRDIATDDIVALIWVDKITAYQGQVELATVEHWVYPTPITPVDPAGNSRTFKLSRPDPLPVGSLEDVLSYAQQKQWFYIPAYCPIAVQL